MTRLSLFIYSLLLTLLTPLRLLAQGGEDDNVILGGSHRSGTLNAPGDDFTDYSPIHFSFSDILLVVALLVACYVFGKIWKGCTYLLLAVAALFFYLNRF